MVDLWTDFWLRETATGQQVAQLHERYMIIIIIIIIIILEKYSKPRFKKFRSEETESNAEGRRDRHDENNSLFAILRNRLKKTLLHGLVHE